MQTLFHLLAQRFFMAVILVLAGLAGASTHAAEAAPDRHIALPLEPARFNISDRFFVAIDPTGSKTLADMQQAEFKPVKGAFASGYTTSAYWLKFTVSDPAERVREWWLEIEPPFLDDVDFFQPSADGQYSKIATGDLHPFSTRDVPNQSFVFRISPKATPTTYYLRLKSSGPIWVKAQLWHDTIFAGETIRHAHRQALSYGAMLLLMFVTLVQAVVLKERVYLAFVAHIAVVLLTLASGVFPLHIPDGAFRVVDALPSVTTCLTVTAYAIFCNFFVLADSQSRLFRWAFFFLATIGVLGALATISPAYRWILPGILLCKIVGTVLPVVATSRKMMRGSFYDKLVWLGLVAYIPAQMILFVRVANPIGQTASWATLHVFTITLLVHLLLLSFALAERMRRVARANQQYQDELSTERQLKQLADKTAFDQRSFLAMVAHELRGPLAMARTATHNLRQLLPAAQLSDQLDTRLTRMDTGLQQMASLVGVCLTHEREGFAQPLSLNLRLTMALLQQRVLPVLSPAVAQRVRWQDDPNNTSQSISGNPALIAIAVRNLIENACRYDTSGGPVEVVWQVQLGDTDENEPWCISVLDNGPGLADEQLGSIFEPFTRVHHKDDSGLGLGLYIVKRIASMHGATASAKRRDRGGMAFSITWGVGPGRPAN